MLSSSLRTLLPVLMAGLVAACASTAQSQDANSTGAASPAALEADVEAEAGYRLGQGDRIGIQVFDEPDLTMESRVGSSGSISYSYLGDLRVAGKTTEQLEGDITKLLADGYLRNPSVNISIIEFRPFFINGEVNRPGSYPYQPGLTLDRAISLAGGLTDRASTRKMFVVKAGATGDAGEAKAAMSTKIDPGDIVSIKEGFF